MIPNATLSTQLAAYEAAKGRLGADARRVLEFVSGHPGVNDDEIAVGLGVPEGTAKAARFDLWIRGLLTEAARPTKTRSGSYATAWVVGDLEHPRPIQPAKMRPKDRPEAYRELTRLVAQAYPSGNIPEALRRLGLWLRYKIALDDKRAIARAKRAGAE